MFEGCDRTGKSTQIKLLSETLNKNGNETSVIAFPDRSTATGKLLDSYLKSHTSLDDRAVHLLFSANRWEVAPSILSSLARGTTVIADRYAYSGVAFSAAKSLEIKWCQQCDVGLPKPDLVLYMSAPQEVLASRGGFGMERYESSEFQERVCKNYDLLRDASWVQVDCSRSVEDVHREIESVVLSTMSKELANVETLWTE